MKQENIEGKDPITIEGKDPITIDCTNPKGGAISKIGTKEFNDSAMEMFGGKPKQETAVEWFANAIKGLDTSVSYYFFQEMLEQAKEMEKQQIIDAHGNQQKKSGGVSNYTYILTGEKYYEETFNK